MQFATKMNVPMLFRHQRCELTESTFS